MNLRYALLWAALGTALVLVPVAAGAQKPGGPRDPADPPLKAVGPADDVRTQVVPFLGTATKQATAEHRTRAGLPDGIGLSVQHVLDDSPAARAGIRPLDVLHKLNDQILVNDPQFRVLLRTFKPGDEIRLTLVRGGQQRRVAVRLGERRVPAGETPAREMLRWMLMPADPGRAVEAVEFAARYEDDQHVLALVCDDQGKQLIARDKQGRLLFQGPIDTEAQRRRVPEAIRPKLKTLESPPKLPQAPSATPGRKAPVPSGAAQK